MPKQAAIVKSLFLVDVLTVRDRDRIHAFPRYNGPCECLAFNSLPSTELCKGIMEMVERMPMIWLCGVLPQTSDLCENKS